jgi:hypothetical protein
MILGLFALFASVYSHPVPSNVMRFPRQFFEPSSVPFIPHVEEGYLAVNLNYALVGGWIQDTMSVIDKVLHDNFDRTWNHRNEAHLTVISPPEYQRLKPYISMERINEIAKRMDIQDTKITPFCVGWGVSRHTRDLRTAESTYYIVVKSEGIERIRDAVLKEAMANLPAGHSLDFKANEINPHITIGFNVDDLHPERDGVYKTAETCFLDVYTN